MVLGEYISLGAIYTYNVHVHVHYMYMYVHEHTVLTLYSTHACEGGVMKCVHVHVHVC